MRAEILRFARLSLSRMHLDGATSRGSSLSTLVEGSDDRSMSVFSKNASHCRVGSQHTAL